MLAFLLVGLQTRSYSIVPDADFNLEDLPELYMFLKFASSQKIGCSIASSSYSSVICSCSDKERDRLLAEYKQNFGIDLLARTKEGRIALSFPNYARKWEKPQQLSKVMEEYSTRSLLHAALLSLIQSKECSKDETVLALSYSLRPVILNSLRNTAFKDFKRGELLQGELEIVRDGHSKTISLRIER